MDKDERFKHIATDPKFRRIPKLERKVKIDKRFHGMFKDEKFKVKYTVDKRGRPVNHSSNDDLKRFYELSSSDEENDNDNEKNDSDESEDEDIQNQSGRFVRPPKSDSDEEKNESNLTKKEKNDKKIPDAIKKKLKNLNVDYARGEGRLVESSSDDDTDLDEDSDDSIEHEWGELDKDAETTDDITKRLAVCNMDWDRIRAVDLMVLFNSFLPPGGTIESVTIYPSEFGKERMKEEEIKGPPELVSKTIGSDDDEEETEEGSKYHMEKLRQYQLNRLKYYYAVAVFDSAETANKIYTECDGLEYESSATKLDLRFIPDEETFDDEPKEMCDSLPDKYQPRFFTTTALQQAKVQLTWDETKPERIEIAKKLAEGKIDDVTDTDLQAYLASSSGEEELSEAEKSESDNEESNPKDSLEKYRQLLNELEKSNEKKNKKDVEMEVTWELNTKDKTEKLVKKKMEESIEKTPFQQYLDKRKQKRKEKKLNKIKNGNDDDDSIHSESDAEIDMNDPYFAEEFNNSEFRKPKKNKNKQENENDANSEDEQEKAQLELLMLDNEEDGKKHFSLKKLEAESKVSKKKKKSKSVIEENNIQEDDFKVDVKDPRFSAIYTSHHYNIDPTDPHYKRTKGMEALVEEKQKRIHINDNDKVEREEEPVKKKSKSELNALVSSVKRKTKELVMKKNKNK